MDVKYANCMHTSKKQLAMYTDPDMHWCPNKDLDGWLAKAWLL